MIVKGIQHFHVRLDGIVKHRTFPQETADDVLYITSCTCVSVCVFACVCVCVCVCEYICAVKVLSVCGPCVRTFLESKHISVLTSSKGCLRVMTWL